MEKLIENLEKLHEIRHSYAEMEKFFKSLVGRTLKDFYKAVKSGDKAKILQNTGAIVRHLASAPAMAGESSLADEMNRLGSKILGAVKGK